MPGDLSGIAKSFAGVLLENSAARDAYSAATNPENDERVAAIVNQYVPDASISASDVPELLPLIEQALADARGEGKTGISGTVIGADEGEEGAGMTVIGAEEGAGMTVIGTDEGEEPPGDDPEKDPKP